MGESSGRGRWHVVAVRRDDISLLTRQKSLKNAMIPCIYDSVRSLALYRGLICCTKLV
jgi:hypothetical protein